MLTENLIDYNKSLVIKKIIIKIMIDLNTKIYVIKIVLDLVFEIDENNIYIKIALIKQIMSMVYLVYCLIILIFKDKYCLIFYHKYFQFP